MTLRRLGMSGKITKGPVCVRVCVCRYAYEIKNQMNGPNGKLGQCRKRVEKGAKRALWRLLNYI